MQSCQSYKSCSEWNRMQWKKQTKHQISHMLSYIIGNNDYAKKVLPSKTSVTKLKTLFRKHLVYYWC